jgi:simple sugar transport system ATP-binding protein
MALADRVTIMRDGAVVASMATSETTREDLAHRMVGREVHLQVTKSVLQRGAPMLEIRQLQVRDESGHLRVNAVTLDVHAGEILGIAGVDGNGQSQLAEALLQLRPIAGGNVLWKGEVASTRAGSGKHISYVPADRRGVGAVMEMSLADNAILGSQQSWTRGPFLHRTRIESHTHTLMQRFGVRGGGIHARASKLSGGNLQKLILGREILRGADGMVIEQPTRGLDAGAVETIWQELLRERERGAAILLISAELEELMNLADRVAVIFEGRIVGIVDAAATTMEELGAMMVGGNSAAASVAR